MSITEITETHRMPRNSSEARAALSIKRGTGEHRSVAWYSFKTRNGTSNHYPINVKPGNELTVYVYSGLPFLEVESGHVTVVFHSRWGNSLTIHPGASAHVIVPSADTKVTISGDETGLTMELPEGEHRVYYPGKYPPLNWSEQNG